MNSALTLLKGQKGFSLLEVLITLLVVSFGLLGMAALIISGVRSNNIAHYRSIASKQTEDIADRMRANLAGVSAGAYDSLTATIPDSSDCVANACSPTQIATYDHSQWNTGNYLITLQWREKEMNGEVDPNCPNGVATNTRCFLTRFSP